MNAKENKMRATQQWVACAVAAVVGGVTLSTTHAATIPYVNDFTSTGFSHVIQEVDGVYTLDTANGVLNYSKPATGGTAASRAGEQVTGLDTSDFVVSTRFTVNDIAGSGNAITIGFSAFSSSSDFVSTAPDSFYLVDWTIGGGTGVGNLRILKQGGTGLTQSGGNAGVGGVTGQSYEIILTGIYDNQGELDMTLVLLDANGNQIGSTRTAHDPTPLSGEFFGLRHRTAGANHRLNVDHHFFSVTAVVPEPASIALLIPVIVGLLCHGRKKLRRIV